MTERDVVTDGEPASVMAAVEADLRRWGPEIAGTGLAAVALSGAQALDDPDLSPTPRSMLMAQVRETLVKLTELAAELVEPDADGIDDLKRLRDERRGA